MAEQFTLVSWNLFQGLHFRAKPGAWVTNDDVVERVRSLDADVLVLPEAWKFREPGATWAEEFAASLGYELHQWISERPSRKRERVPWRMVVLTRIPARRLTDHELPAYGPLGPRAFVRVELEESGLSLAGAHVYGIHLLIARQLRGWNAERRELRTIAMTTDIIAGDLNMWGPVVSRGTPDHVQAVRGRTYPAHRPHSQIDHILVNDRVEVVSSEVLPEMGSDHRAIRATLRPIRD